MNSITSIVSGLISDFTQDFQHAVRLLWKRKVFSLAVIFTLGVGIAANGTIFTVINGLLLRPVSPVESDRLARVYVSSDAGKYQRMSYRDYRDFAEGNPAFEGLAAVSQAPLALGRGRHSEQILAEVVSPNYFQALSPSAFLGRTLHPDFDTRSDAASAVLSYELWRRLFDSDRNVTGQRIELNGRSFEVVGVVDRDFRGTYAGVLTGLWISVTQASWLGNDWREDRNRPSVQVIGKMKPGVTLEQARAALQTQAANVFAQRRTTNASLTVNVAPATLLHGSLRAPIVLFLSMLMALVFLVLVVACANVANLFLIFATSRRRELAVRLCIGSTRSRLIRQILTESSVIALASGIAGLVISRWISLFIPALNPIPSIPLHFDLSADWRVYLFLFLASFVAGIFLGFFPALQVTRSLLSNALQSQTMAAGMARAPRLRTVLVVGQVAISLVLLIGSHLFVRSLQNAAGLNLGFDPSHIVALDLDLENTGYNMEDGKQFYTRLLERARVLDGVQSAALSDLAPVDLATSSLDFSQTSEFDASGPIRVSFNTVDTGYFGTLSIPILRGRSFEDRDTTTSGSVAIINQAMAGRYWPGKNPLSEAFWIRDKSGSRRVEIIGVAQDVKYRTLGEESQPHLYLPFSQDYRSSMTLLVKGPKQSGQLIAALQKEIQSLDGSVQGFFARTMEQHLEFALLPAKLAAIFSSIFGFIAILLAVTGLYGAIAYSVSQRTKEFGIRIALGAQSGDLLTPVIAQGLMLTAIGVLIGAGLTLVLSRFISGFLYGISSTDPLVYILSAAALGVVAVLAAYLPARKATQTDPVIVLRYE